MRSRLAITTGVLLLCLVAYGLLVFPDRLLAFPSEFISHSRPSPGAPEAGRADIFLNSQLSPALITFQTTLPVLQSQCTPDLPLACRTAIANSDHQLRRVLFVIDEADIPACLVSALQRYRADISTLEGGLRLSLGGYQQESHQIVVDGLDSFNTSAILLVADTDALNRAALTCQR